MLFPRFSLRFIFALTAICAVLFLVMAWGIRGTGWALGMTMAVVMLGIIAVVYAAMFGLVWIFGSITGAARQRAED